MNDEKLREVWQKTLLADPKRLAQLAGTTQAKAKEFLANETTAQRGRKVINHSHLEISNGGPPGTFSVDLLFWPKLKGANNNKVGTVYFLNNNTRFVAARPFSRKTGPEISKLFSEIVTELRQSGKLVRHIITDSGKEWLNKDFTKKLIELELSHKAADPETHSLLSRLDRSVKTHRDMLERWFEISGTHRWVDKLQEVIAEYNASPRRTIGMSPNDAHRGDNELRIRQADVARVKEVEPRIKLQVGDMVRNLKNRLAFAKGSTPKWSKKVRPIVAKVGPNTFQVQGKATRAYKVWELQKVTEVKPSKPLDINPEHVVNFGKVRAARRLAKEHLLEPIYSERTPRNKPVDYRRLAGLSAS